MAGRGCSSSPPAWSRDPCPTPAAIARPRSKPAFLRQILGPEAGRAPAGSAAGNGAPPRCAPHPRCFGPEPAPAQAGNRGYGRVPSFSRVPWREPSAAPARPGPGSRRGAVGLTGASPARGSGTERRCQTEREGATRTAPGPRRNPHPRAAGSAGRGPGSRFGRRDRAGNHRRGSRPPNGRWEPAGSAGQTPAPPTRNPSFRAGRSRPGEGAFV